MTVQGELTRIGARVQITQPEKIFFPDDKITKQDLVDYYRSIAPWILPHLRGRPLALERYPDGIDKPGFFQKTAPLLSGWIEDGHCQKENGRHRPACRLRRRRHADLSGKSGMHHSLISGSAAWTSSMFPTRWSSILDPSADSFEPVKAAAQSLKDLLDHLGLSAYLKTTGLRGLHVAVPLKRQRGFRFGARLCEGGREGPSASGAWGANAWSNGKARAAAGIRGHEP